MPSLKQILENFILIIEAKGSGYDDEHATVSVWNHVIGHKNEKKLIKSADAIHHEIDSAKKDSKHPLNFKNAKEGFTGGKKPEHESSYYNELHHAAETVHSLANHPGFKDSVKAKARAKVAGASRGKLSDTWKNAGAKNATSKADIEIGNRGESHHKSISLKKGDSQLMSAQPEELHATYEHATNEHMKSDKKFTAKHKEQVMKYVKKIKEHLSSMAGAKPEKQREHRDKAQALVNKIHDEHPNLLSHVHHEASTGHGKFGHGQEGSARYLVTSTPKGAHVHDTETNHEPIVAGRPRIALPKGSGRPGNAKIDYKAVKSNG